MAVSSSDKTDSRNVNQQKTEEYRNQIESKEKKHRAEVARLRKQHYEGTQQSNEAHQKEIEDLRGNYKTATAEKDQYYRNEMDKLNNLHRQRLRDQAEDMNEKMQVTRDSSARDIKANKELQERTRERLESNYQNQIKKMDGDFRDYAENARVSQKESYEAQKTKYNKDKQKTVETLTEDHQKQIANAQRDLTNERDYRKEEVGALKNRMTEQAESMRKSFRSSLERDRKFNEDLIAARDTDQKDSIQNIKNRYQEALKENTEATNHSQSKFKTDIANRMNERIDYLESSIADQEKEYQGKTLRNERANEAEKNEIRREMKKSLDLVNEQKQEAGEIERKRSRAELGEVRLSHEKELQDKIRYYQGQLAEMREKHKMQMNEKDVTVQWRENQLNKQTGNQVKNIKEATAKEQKNLINYYEANLEDTKMNHRKDKIEFQSNYMEERSRSIASLNKKLQDLEQQYTTEKAKQTQGHANQIEDIAFNHRVDKDRLEKRHRETIENLQKSHARELQYTKNTSEAKMSEINKQHREEMQRMQDRHTQEMAALASHKPKV